MKFAPFVQRDADSIPLVNSATIVFALTRELPKIGAGKNYIGLGAPYAVSRDDTSQLVFEVRITDPAYASQDMFVEAMRRLGYRPIEDAPSSEQ